MFCSGVISRFDAEKLLIDKPLGSYLVRVSEKVWGYTISYRAAERCKHFLIDASEEQYHFFGPNQLNHNSITDLVNYHKVRNSLIHLQLNLMFLYFYLKLTLSHINKSLRIHNHRIFTLFTMHICNLLVQTSGMHLI